MLKEIFILIILSLGVFLFAGLSDAPLDIRNQNKGDSVDQPKESYLGKDEVVISRVIDGDTVTVMNGEGREERIRLLLIDTPESVHPTEPVQVYGKEASKFAKEYLKQGQKVTLERGNPEKDKYDRTLGYIFVDGVNFNQLMIEKGYARVAYVYEPNTKYIDEFKKAERKAEKNKLNIWSITDYVTDKGFDMSVVD